MKPETEQKFELIRQFFSQLNSDLVMVFEQVRTGAGDFKWCGGSSAYDKRKHQDYDVAAAYYLDLVKSCFQRRQNWIGMEYVGESPPLQVLGVTIRKAKPRPGPANAQGQRWWVMVIGAGPIREAGHALVARVGSKGPREMKGWIRQVEKIFIAN